MAIYNTDWKEDKDKEPRINPNNPINLGTLTKTFPSPRMGRKARKKQMQLADSWDIQDKELSKERPVLPLAEKKEEN